MSMSLRNIPEYELFNDSNAVVLKDTLPNVDVLRKKTILSPVPNKISGLPSPSISSTTIFITCLPITKLIFCVNDDLDNTLSLPCKRIYKESLLATKKSGVPSPSKSLMAIEETAESKFISCLFE
ncbi:hypothetical protein D3C87_1028900 [compost metagenome]